MLSRSRPDFFDACVNLWLSAAVGLAAVATAPLEGFRAPLADGALGEGEDLPPFDPVTVSPVRPADLAAAPPADRAASETCGNCRHFHRGNSQAGECRFGPPSTADGGRRAEWPIAIVGDWCGQFFKAHVPGLTREDLDALH